MLLLLLAMQATDVPSEVNVNVQSCPICNVVKLIRGDPKARDRKAVGKMLANGDCAGAEKYALEKGNLDLADRVKARCAPSRVQTLDPNREVGDKTSGSESDWDFAKQPE